eukprot:77879-Pelagomonas_calceolata.AAC.3
MPMLFHKGLQHASTEAKLAIRPWIQQFHASTKVGARATGLFCTSVYSGLHSSRPFQGLGLSGSIKASLRPRPSDATKALTKATTEARPQSQRLSLA